MICIIDYGVGNLFSLKSSLAHLGLEAKVSADAADIRAADRLILPGVGAFGDAMAKLEATGLVPVIREEAAKKPLLGICLGMQLLFEKSYEYGEHDGLGFVPGQVCPLAPDLGDKSLKVPQIGWNAVHILRDDPLFKYVRDGEYFYYVHSYYGKNFVKTMLNVGKNHDTVRVVNDQIGTPTYTFDLARLLVDMIETDKYGIYHGTNEGGYISWYDFTCEIYRQAGMDIKVIPVSTEEYGLSKAARPFNSRLDKSKLKEAGFTPLPTWQNAVERYIKYLKEQEQATGNE